MKVSICSEDNNSITIMYSVTHTYTGQYGCALLPSSNTKFGLSTFPLKYNSNVNCVYYLLSRRQKVKLTFLYLDIINADCSQDRIEIYDGFTASGPSLTICNGNEVVEFISKGRNVKMIYLGTSVGKYRGFHALMTFL